MCNRHQFSSFYSFYSFYKYNKKYFLVFSYSDEFKLTSYQFKSTGLSIIKSMKTQVNSFKFLLKLKNKKRLYQFRVTKEF